MLCYVFVLYGMIDVLMIDCLFCFYFIGIWMYEIEVIVISRLFKLDDSVEFSICWDEFKLGVRRFDIYWFISYFVICKSFGGNWWSKFVCRIREGLKYYEMWWELMIDLGLISKGFWILFFVNKRYGIFDFFMEDLLSNGGIFFGCKVLGGVLWLYGFNGVC